MEPSIETLVPDIYKLITSGKGEQREKPSDATEVSIFGSQDSDKSSADVPWFTPEISDALRTSLSGRLHEHFNTQRYAPGKATLRMSGLGRKCPRALWYSIHHPEMAVPLPPWTEVKFAFGTILEALAITLAKAAGHSVLGEQDELILDGIIGHRDAVIDGMVVDVKSCSDRQFKKIKSGAIEQDDSFGYLDQLGSYVVASRDDPLVRYKDMGGILAIHKELGHMYLHAHAIKNEREIRERIDYYKEVVGLCEPPACECRTRAQGASGNIQLAFPSSYSPQRYCCFPHLRTFIYAQGPVYLTKVVQRPNVPEVNQYGKYVF